MMGCLARCREEEMRLALAVSRSRELQKELDAVEASGGRGLSLPEAAQLPTWPSAQQMGVILEQGRSARATLYERNLGLAHKGAYSYYTHSDRSVPYPDLVQVCCTSCTPTSIFCACSSDVAQACRLQGLFIA